MYQDLLYENLSELSVSKKYCLQIYGCDSTAQGLFFLFTWPRIQSSKTTQYTISRSVYLPDLDPVFTNNTFHYLKVTLVYLSNQGSHLHKQHISLSQSQFTYIPAFTHKTTHHIKVSLFTGHGISLYAQHIISHQVQFICRSRYQFIHTS